MLKENIINTCRRNIYIARVAMQIEKIILETQMLYCGMFAYIKLNSYKNGDDI